MSAIPQPLTQLPTLSDEAKLAANEAFLKFLPAVETHASIQFRHLNKSDREEAIAEATAAAFLNFRKVTRKGLSHALTPSSLAHYAVLHVKGGRHVGGTADGHRDVMSRFAQARHGFTVTSLSWDDPRAYNCVEDPSSRVWRDVLGDDTSTPVPDQAAFRIDWSAFLGQQHDRTRTAIALLAEGRKRCDVADRMGTTAPALTQRMARVEREWDRWQGAEPNNDPDQDACAQVPPKENRCGNGSINAPQPGEAASRRSRRKAAGTGRRG